jgi:hypothetical protein
VKRRALLASVSAGLSGFAGCAGFLGGEQRQTLTPVELPPSATATPAGVSAATQECPSSGGDARYVPLPFDEVPPPPERFRSLDCPQFGGDRRVICYHSTAATDELLLVGGRQATLDPVEGTFFDFVLWNRLDEGVRLQPGTWSIHRRTDDGWTRATAGRPGCTTTIPSGNVYWWRLGIDRTVENPWTNVTTVERSLGESVYVLAVPVRLTEGTERVVAAAFEVRRTDESQGSATTSDS